MNKVVPIDYHKISTDKILEPDTQLKINYLKYKEMTEVVDSDCLDLFRCLCCFCILCSDKFEKWFIGLCCNN